MLRCPHCQGELSFIGSWTVQGAWGYKEVRTYECSSHGPVFLSPERGPTGHRPDESRKSTNNGDRDSLIMAPRKPAPTLDAGAIAIPEPDSD